ncbi:MAG: NAD-dependent epimerase/dehydratase family protein [Actinomycetota bacterium]|nr:NAD-dependent epimerase/dehydratase family protein [Actinomycetota bacterium]
MSRQTPQTRALVTGGGGFIGHHLVRRLLADGYEVRVLDNFATGRRERLEGLDVSLVEGDLRSYERAHTAVRGRDLVFHLGALPSVPRSVQDPLTTSAVNVEGTLNVLLAARDEGVRRVVFASSSSVYGSNTVLPKSETDQPLPVSPYGVSKLSAEHYCRAFTAVYGLETVSLRLFNVFGPGQDPLSQYAAVVPRFIRALASGDRPIVYGDGSQTRDFTYIDDVVEAFLLASGAPQAVGEVINVAAGRETSLLELLSVLSDLFGISAAPVFEAVRVGEVRASQGDRRKAAALLDWEPRWSLKAALEASIAPAHVGVTR